MKDEKFEVVVASLYVHIFVWMFYTFILTSLVIKGQSLVKKNVKLLDLLFTCLLGSAESVVKVQSDTWVFRLKSSNLGLSKFAKPRQTFKLCWDSGANSPVFWPWQNSLVLYYHYPEVTQQQEL